MRTHMCTCMCMCTCLKPAYVDRASQVGLVVKNLPANAGEVGSIPGSGRSPGEGNGNPLQYSCLENSMDRRTWWVRIHGVGKSQRWLNTLKSKEGNDKYWQAWEKLESSFHAGETIKHVNWQTCSTGEGNGSPLQYSCLENSIDRRTWWATVHGIAESDTTEWLSTTLSVDGYLMWSHIIWYHLLTFPFW